MRSRSLLLLIFSLTSSVYAEGYRVDASKLRVRREPSMASETTGHLTRGELVTVIEKTTFTATIDNITGPWLLIQNASGLKGWAFGGYIKPISDTTNAAKPIELP